MNGKWKAWLFVGLIFAAGILTGVALTIGTRPSWNHPPNPGRMEHDWIRNLTYRLDLTPDQQTKIEPIVADAENSIRNVHREELSRMSAVFQQTDEKINPILTPEQQQKFTQMQQERPPEFPHWHHFGHGPGDGGLPPGPSSFESGGAVSATNAAPGH